MALIKCPECSNDVSDKATCCPKCGHPLLVSHHTTFTPPPPDSDLDALIKRLLSSGDKIAAIKIYRHYNPSAGLADAKQYVERLEIGIPPGTVTKPFQKPSPIVVFGGLFLGLAVVFAIIGQISLSSDNNSTASAQGSAEIPLSYIPWSEIDEIYNVKSAYTNLQKDEFWKKYQGKKVRWTGTVKSISDSFGSLNLQLKMNSGTLLIADVYVRLKNTERSKALTLQKGDSISFTGILEKWGTLLPITLNDGKIE